MHKAPTFARLVRDNWWAALLHKYFWERLIPRLEPTTCFFGWKALSIPLRPKVNK